MSDGRRSVLRSAMEEGFRKYLETGLDPAAAEDLCRQLHLSGLQTEGTALQTYIGDGAARAVSVDLGGIWRNRRCVAGPYPPAAVRSGDMWFDTVELTPMILLPRRADVPPDRGDWFATHPVYVWQFRAFLSLVKTGRKRIGLPVPLDYLRRDRFESLGSKEFITNVYHDEAIAYSHGFGK